jgi:hypothetical protein
MIQSILLIIAYLILFAGVFLVKKSQKELRLIPWLAVSLLITMMVQAFAGGILYVIKGPDPVWFVGLFDAIIGFFLLFLTFRKGLQSYKFEVIDLLAAVLVIALAYYYGHRLFGSGLYPNFSSTDAATHFTLARNIALLDRIDTNLFFSAVNTAYLMKIALPFLTSMKLTKVYVGFEILQYLLSGAAFYLVIEKYSRKSRFLQGMSLLLILAYMIGYPLYGMEFGFTYFNMSIVIIAVLIYFLQILFDDSVEKLPAVILVNLGLYSVFASYTLFVPAVYFGVFLAILLRQFYKKNLFSKETFFFLCAVFLLPCICGLLISWENIKYLLPGSVSQTAVQSSGDEQRSAISLDGGCYNDLYSSFVLVFPLAFYGYMKGVKNKLESLNMTLLPVMILFTGAMAYMALSKRVSVYYLVKNNSLLWLLFWLLAFYGICELSSRVKGAVISYVLMFALLLGSLYLNFDARVTAKNERMITGTTSGFLGVYAFAKDFLAAGTFHPLQMDLYEYVSENCAQEAGETLTVGDDYFCIWSRVLTGEDLFSLDGSEKTLGSLYSDNTKYLLVENELYEANKSYLEEAGEIVYSNDKGFVIKLNDQE